MNEGPKKLHQELGDYFGQLMKPEYREELRNAEAGDLYKPLIRQMGKDGMLALGLGLGWAGLG